MDVAVGGEEAVVAFVKPRLGHNDGSLLVEL